MPGHIWKASQGNLAGLYLNDRWGSFLKYNILIREHAFADRLVEWVVEVILSTGEVLSLICSSIQVH